MWIPSKETHTPSCNVCTNDLRLVTHYCTPSWNVCTNNLRLVTHYCTPSCTVYTNNLRLVTHCTPSCHVCTSNFRLVTHYCTPSCNVCTNDLRLATCHKSSSSCQVFFSSFSFPFRNKSHFQSQEKPAALTQNISQCQCSQWNCFSIQHILWLSPQCTPLAPPPPHTHTHTASPLPPPTLPPRCHQIPWSSAHISSTCLEELNLVTLCSLFQGVILFSSLFSHCFRHWKQQR